MKLDELQRGIILGGAIATFFDWLSPPRQWWAPLFLSVVLVMFFKIANWVYGDSDD